MINKQTRIITLGFAVLLSLMSALIITALEQMQGMQQKLDKLSQQHNAKTELISTIRDGIYNRQVSLRNMMLMTDPFERDEESGRFRQFALPVLEARNHLSDMKLTQPERQIMDQIIESMKVAYHFQQNVLRKVIFSESPEEYQPLLSEAFNKQAVIVKHIHKMFKLLNSETKKAVTEAEQSYQDSRNVVFLLGGAALFIGILITIFIVRQAHSQSLKVQNALRKLKESHELLEHRVKERTQELAIARDEALASNKAKGIFLANMSHELRTPMNAIIGYSELLEEDAIEDENNTIVPDLKKIQASAKHLLSLINGILDLSKIDADKIELSPIQFEINELIEEVSASIAPLLLENNNAFHIKAPRDNGIMFADNLRLRQILLNLLSNACKFTSNGSITLTIKRYNQNYQDWVSFAVADTGIGIEAEYMDTIFDDFSQADASTTREYGGTGLGLSISKRLVEIMHGQINIESTPGKGTCFTFNLPVETDVAVVQKSVQAS